MARSQLHLDRLRLRHLRLLDLIDSKHSLRAVGEALNLTQPAVSQMVKDLEQAFGAALVDRSVKGAALTPLGQHALQRARAGLAIFDHLAAELDAEPPPLVRIGTNPALTYHVLPRALAVLRSESPSMRFRIAAGIVADMTHQLLDGTLDCYVGRIDWQIVPQGMAPLLHVTPLLETEFAIVCPADHPMAERREIAAAELLEWPWALSTADTNNRSSLDAAFRNCGLAPPDPAIEIRADPNALMAFSNHVNMLTCVPRTAFEALNDIGQHKALHVPDLRLALIQTSFMTLAESQALPAMQALRRALLIAAGPETP